MGVMMFINRRKILNFFKIIKIPKRSFDFSPKEANLFKNRLHLSQLQKAILLAGSSLYLLIADHKRLDLLNCFAELTSSEAISQILPKMRSHNEGNQVLFDKPIINSKQINSSYLKSLSENTFGFEYQTFLGKYGFNPDNYMAVRFTNDSDVAYVMMRYRQIHDVIHVITKLPPNKLGEISIKWLDIYSVGLPVCYIGALLGPLLMNQNQRDQFKNYYLPWVFENITRISIPLIFIYWEKRWEQDIKELRNEIGIYPFDTSKLNAS